MTRSHLSAVDSSSAYSAGRGDKSALFLTPTETRREALYADVQDRERSAMAAWWACDQGLCALLYGDLANAWRSEGFEDEAARCESMIANPYVAPKPKTIGLKTKGKK